MKKKIELNIDSEKLGRKQKSNKTMKNLRKLKKGVVHKNDEDLVVVVHIIWII